MKENEDGAAAPHPAGRTTGTFMRKLALSEDILNTVEKPARYVGGELNAVMKNKDEVDLRFAFCFPDVYDIGMGNLGMQIVRSFVAGCLVLVVHFVAKGFCL